MGAPRYKEIPKKRVKLDLVKEKSEAIKLRDSLVSTLSSPEKIKKAALIIEQMINQK
jgi:hypothetical protein